MKVVSPHGRLLPALLLLAGAALCWSAPPCAACSLFVLDHPEGAVYGQNLDWDEPLPALVLVNKRGAPKKVLPWRGFWPAPDPQAPVTTWTSRYGSVTFTLWGRDFIESGMNEAGLIVDQASLGADYPPDDGRPGISCAQWLQYQLDNFATVAEVLAHLDDLRPDGEGWHYLIADRAGRAAVIEYLDGNPSVYTGEELPYPALTNTTYTQALDTLPLDRAFGGKGDIAGGEDSYGRFATMAALLRGYDPRTDGPPLARAWDILEQVRVATTLRSVVHDAGRGRVSWSTREDPRLRWLDLADLDFSPGAVQYLDVNLDLAGNTVSALADCTAQVNRECVFRMRGGGADDEETVRLLAERGLTLTEALDLIADNPGD